MSPRAFDALQCRRSKCHLGRSTVAVPEVKVVRPLQCRRSKCNLGRSTVAVPEVKMPPWTFDRCSARGQNAALDVRPLPCKKVKMPPWAFDRCSPLGDGKLPLPTRKRLLVVVALATGLLLLQPDKTCSALLQRSDFGNSFCFQLDPPFLGMFDNSLALQNLLCQRLLLCRNSCLVECAPDCVDLLLKCPRGPSKTFSHLATFSRAAATTGIWRTATSCLAQEETSLNRNDLK